MVERAQNAPQLQVAIECKGDGHVPGLGVDEKDLAGIGMAGPFRDDLHRVRVAQLPAVVWYPTLRPEELDQRSPRVDHGQHSPLTQIAPGIVEHLPGKALEIIHGQVGPHEAIGALFG